MSDKARTPKDKAKELTIHQMERQLFEGFHLCNEVLQDPRGLTPTLVIVMLTMVHNFHFYLMIKHVPQNKWPEKLLFLGATYEIQ